jgi:hypothetical protein
MGPTLRHPNRRATLADGFGQLIIAGVTVNLQDAVEAGKEGFGIIARAAGGVEVNDTGRVFAAPRSVIAGQRHRAGHTSRTSIGHRRCIRWSLT